MTLLARLEAACSDEERRAVLAQADREELERLAGELTYHAWIAESQAAVDAEREAFAQFERELAAAPDDEARAKVIRARDPRFLAEWSWQRTATAAAWGIRYNDLIRSG